FKTFSYLVHWQARKGAEAAGFDEAILLNEDGHLASGAMTNLFWAKAGRLFTPAHEAGCRKGAVRRWIAARQPLEEGRFPAAVLDDADEVFLANSWIGIRPVTRIGERPLPAAPGPVTEALALRYRTEVAASA
ncbi:MAG TPA: aminotransferase class IV, partial [Candidatus Methylacidiphilales bacterium]